MIPHAYAIEILSNPGTYAARWQLDHENEPGTLLADVSAERDEMIACGWDPDHVRVVALVSIGGRP